MEDEATLKRKAIALGPQCAITINILRTKGSLFDLFGIDYEDTREAHKEAAKEFMKHIDPVCSVNFLWALREAAAETIKAHNRQFGSSHPIDRLKEPEE